MQLLPPHFLFRLTYQCQYAKDIPDEEGDRLLDLPKQCRIDNFAGLDDRKNFADVRLSWNELGIGFQVEVRGKEREPQGAADRPRSSDGAQLWIDTRDTRNIHRASRYCHHFYVLPAGAGAAGDEPVAGQIKINRAMQDAPLCRPEQMPFQVKRTKSGYVAEMFLPASVLQGFDPETNPRLGFFYWIRDSELGDQTLSVGTDFPFWEDPSLWSTLELTGGPTISRSPAQARTEEE
jgi:hypothetical protein